MVKVSRMKKVIKRDEKYLRKISCRNGDWDIEFKYKDCFNDKIEECWDDEKYLAMTGMTLQQRKVMEKMYDIIPDWAILHEHTGFI